MTIDIQWIRHHPDQVREWQQCRGLPEATTTATVDQVIQHDQDARQALHTLRLYRQRLNSIAKELRTERDNVTLVEERGQLQVLVQQFEDQVADKKHQVQILLERLASPTDKVLLEQFPLFPKESIVASSASASPTAIHQDHSHWYQTNSLLWTALEFFGQKYSTRHIPSEYYNSTPSPPPVSNSSSSASTSSSPTTPPVAATTAAAADWKSWVSKSIPRKAIYGAKQLPQYTLLQRQPQDHDNKGVSLECLAMTAGSMWDSRQVQLELATELQSFYQSLIISAISHVHPTTTVPITMYTLPAPKLEQHELSRILLVAQKPHTQSQEQQQQDEQKQYILGWVSNFGDALSRANDIRFRGGGLQESKEFVYWVHATILSPWTLPHLTAIILQSQYGKENASNSNNHKERLPAWAQCNHPSYRKKESAASTPLSPPQFTTRLMSNTHSQPSRRMDLTLHSKSAEAVSCPFGFLL